VNATRLWMLWQAILAPYADCFTRPGFHRFVEWLTGLALNVEEHTITQSLYALERTDDWKALEAFAEYGAWDRDAVERVTTQLVQEAPGRLWHGYHVWAGDDTKVHRTSKHVWGTNTFHEYTARCPNRATTVRAHNGVVVGALLHNPEQPAWFVPVAGRLYFRRSQLPTPGSNGAPPVTFQTKCELMVALGRQLAQTVPGKHLLVLDGGYALQNVLRPLAEPSGGWPRVDVLTRLRHDARLYDRPADERRPGQRGRQPRWGRRLPPPRQGGRWSGPWRQQRVFVYGRMRLIRWKERCALWHVTGADRVVKVVVAQVEGYRERFTLVTTAVALSGAQMVELFCARYRQEDGFRDLKQRLGWEECRAWTRAPIERTTQALFVCLTLLRLLQFHLAAAGREDWWEPPPWNTHKRRPSVLDLERLLRQHAAVIRRLLAAWLGERETSAAGAPQPTVT
jgi:hypothetical protein